MRPRFPKAQRHLYDKNLPIRSKTIKKWGLLYAPHNHGIETRDTKENAKIRHRHKVQLLLHFRWQAILRIIALAPIVEPLQFRCCDNRPGRGKQIEWVYLVVLFGIGMHAHSAINKNEGC